MAESRANAKSVAVKDCLGAKTRNKRARLNYVASAGKSPENSLDILAAAAMAMEYLPQLEKKDEILTEILSFPEDLVEEIFLWLPIKSVIKFRCLSKFWYGQIVHPSFIRKYHCDENEEYYTTSFADKTSHMCCKVLGSCDGFYCYYLTSAWRGMDIYLYNPSIRRAVKIPNYPFSDGRGLGVGYEDSTDDVKLVKTSNKDGSTMIYSANENTWETINDACPDSIVTNILSVFIRGCIYWCGKTTLLAFDLSKNVFRQIPYPSTHGSRSTYYSLSVVKGSLCFMPRPRGDDYCWIYKLKQEENGWEEIYQGWGPEKGSMYAFGLTGECNILVERFDIIGCRMMIFAYDIQTKQEKFIRYGKLWGSWVSIRKKSLQLLHYPGQYLHPHEFI